MAKVRRTASQAGKRNENNRSLRYNITELSKFSADKSIFRRGYDKAVIVLAYFFKKTGKCFSGLGAVLRRGAVVWSVLGILALSGIIISAGNIYSVGVRISFGDLTVFASSPEAFDDVKKQVEDRITEVTGDSFYFEKLPTYSLSLIKNTDIADNDEIYTSLYEEAEDSLGNTFGLYVDGVLVGSHAKELELLSAVEELKEFFTDDSAIEQKVSFTNSITTEKDMYSKATSKSTDELIDIFTKPADDKMYTVEKGDSLESIAEKFNITVSELRLINPDVDFDEIVRGDKVYITPPEISLNVVVEKTVTEDITVKYKTEKSYSSSMFENQTKTTRAGKNGITRYTYSITVVDGVEISRETVGSEVIESVVNSKVTVGTKKIAPSGSFILPLKSYVYTSDGYGWRTIFGRREFHPAVDLAAKMDTPIYAADAGTVKYAGWKSGGSGITVIIDHGDGVETRYYHCNSVAVEAGDKVYQGQTVAYVGTTGTSTGYHLHFEIRINGQSVDPNKYINFPK